MNQPWEPHLARWLAAGLPGRRGRSAPWPHSRPIRSWGGPPGRPLGQPPIGFVPEKPVDLSAHPKTFNPSYPVPSPYYSLSAELLKLAEKSKEKENGPRRATSQVPTRPATGRPKDRA